MTTRNNDASAQLASFIEDAIGDDNLRIDCEFGHGFVRLKTSEAEKRQAAQDIRSSEDIVIELLRNARDAGASHVFLATQRSEQVRSIIVIDDGCGIPDDMRDRIFEPRVTSKLDTANMDRWGLHGRGMALYSIRVNAQEACVVDTVLGGGTAISVSADMHHLTEKRDQSTFPAFEVVDNALVMRGPKNIVRTTTEFALEHKDTVQVHYGSVTEIAAALAAFGAATISPVARAFGRNGAECKLVQRLALATDPEEFAQLASGLGLLLSARSARRIMDGQIAPPETLFERISAEALPQSKRDAPTKRRLKSGKPTLSTRKLAGEDLTVFADQVSAAFDEMASKYFLRSDVPVTAHVVDGVLRVDIPLVEED
ncbi:ATP-binding protein [Adlercreutzia murintestinalis]|uniref:ATP-binding protein n=1 Tax=Adlercreutzia murintestinalis TaxID=2941325 RepID=UPI00203E6DE1|nr:ATP-binding protein [Adlercreutzia murintestinalis]